MTIADVQQAALLIGSQINPTPVFTYPSLDDSVGARVFFKCENFQRSGSFKFRGASNATLSLSEEEAQRGVVTHSSGNHAAGLALAAKERGIATYIVMPNNASAVKRAAVEDYGGHIILCEDSQQEREAKAAEVVARTGGTLIHPSGDPRVVAGQGTASLELLTEVPNLDLILAPVGGGGLLSGTAITTAGMAPKTKVMGIEPENANDAYLSFKTGTMVYPENPNTIADGLCTSLNDLTFPIILNHVTDIITVNEAAIIDALKYAWNMMKLVIEPSAAVPLAAVLGEQIDIKNKRIGIILSGGNVDLHRLHYIASSEALSQ